MTIAFYKDAPSHIRAAVLKKLRATALLFSMAPCLAYAAHTHHAGDTSTLPQIPPNAAHMLNNSPETPLTPAQQVALPDGGAPPPPHGYTEVEDTEATLSNFSAQARTHAPLGLPGGNAQQRTNGPNNLPSHFSIYGMPVKFNAPVIAPYQSDRTPSSYAGQTTKGSTDLLVNGDSSDIH